MKFTTIIAAALSYVSIVQGATVAPRSALVVYVPKILDPNSGTVWTVGNVETVKWDASDAPVNISNGAAVDLHGSGRFIARLVQGFDLRSGSVNVTVPDVAPGLYTITLFGDSGNISPSFQINAGENDVVS